VSTEDDHRVETRSAGTARTEARVLSVLERLEDVTHRLDRLVEERSERDG
jgi:hypothetical protein